jgi:hypothetical protein
MATLNAGSGVDGNATASSSINLNTTSLIGRSYGDMVSYSCSSVGAQGCTVTATPDGLTVGDEVLLINIRGVGINGGTLVANEGNYETFEISEINGNNISFTTAKTKLFGDDGGDTNIGTTTATNQKVMLQRVPNYNNLTINGGISVTGNSYSPKDGVLFLRVKETLTINGNIAMTGVGPSGGSPKISGGGGPYVNPDGGIGHPVVGGWNTGATGGSYGALATQGSALPAPIYGSSELTELQMGSGGGAASGSGGRGGGVIALFATTLHLYGQLYARGGVGGGHSSYGGGGGSGGAILMHAGTLWMHSSTTSLAGGAGGSAIMSGQPGAEGRLGIYYNTLGDSLTGADVTPYVDSALQLPYSISGTASEDCTVRIYDSSWVFVRAVAVSGGAYEVVNLPNAGPFYVVSEADTDGKNLISYKSVIPKQ